MKSQLPLAPLMKLSMPLNYTSRIWFLWTSLSLEASMASLGQSLSAATTMCRVVFLTAHADDQTMEHAVAAGAFGYVLKPFSGAGLKAAIETALHKHQTEMENRRGLDRGYL